MKASNKFIIYLIIWVTFWTGIYYYNEYKLIKNGEQFEKEAMKLDIDQIHKENKRMKFLRHKPIEDGKWPIELQQKASFANIYREIK